MKPDLSKHVCEEMERRGIPLAAVESVLARPQQKVPEHGLILCYQSQMEINQKAISGAGHGQRNGLTAESRDRLPDQQNHKVLENNMKVTYDPEVDVLRIIFCSAPIEESDEDKPGVIFDYDKSGNVVGLEILNASQRVENPRGVDYAVTG